MDVALLFILVILALALVLGWSHWHGASGPVGLYPITAAILLSLCGAALAEAAGLPRHVELLNVSAIALSLAALPSGAALWESQLRRDFERTRVYHAFRPDDWLTWRGWLKLVDRLGARAAALLYLAAFGLGLAAEVAATLPSRPAPDRDLALLALSAPLLFALFSAFWVYRGATRLIPGA